MRASFFDAHRLKNWIKDSISNIALTQRCPILRGEKQSAFSIADELPEQFCNFGVNIDISDCVPRFHLTRKFAAFRLLTTEYEFVTTSTTFWQPGQRTLTLE